MDRRTLLAVFLCVGVYYIWLNQMEAKVAAQRAAQGVDGVEAPAPKSGKTPAPAVAAKPDPAPAPAPVRKVDYPIVDVPFEGCRSAGVLNTDGGVLRNTELMDWEAAYAVQPIYSWAFGLASGASELPWKPYGDPPGLEKVLSEDARIFAAGTGDVTTQPVYKVVRGGDSVVLEAVTDDGIVVTKTLSSVPGEPCQLALDVTWRNPGGTRHDGGLWLGLHEKLSEGGGGGFFAAYQNVKQPMAYVGDDYELFSGYPDLEVGKPEVREGSVSWVGLADRYFGLFVVPEEGSSTRLSFSAVQAGDSKLHGAHLIVEEPLQAGASHTEKMRIYVGALDMDVLAQVHPEMTRAVELGWFALFAKVLLLLLNWFYAAVGNWGLAIVLLTVLVKLLFFPLTQRAFKSSQAMAAIQPMLQEIREKYKDNQEEQNRRTIELFREHNVNPLGGCLPMLIQFPVWIALYRVLLSSVDLYHTEFLYLRDLSSVDPYAVLPATVVGLMLIQQQFMPTGNMDPAQARMMKIMPLIFGVFFFVFPAGLVVYIFMNMTLSVAQQWFIKRTYKGPGPATAEPAPTAK